ncbi:alpha/beta hydrolase [Chengkuizengella sediminis]|uniref:alpha/beta hydrolase n=1 Tax=Chengkuizengella sediminis TaxID=1885917 RepID=UPI001389E1A0|nr:alpha/beta hydrolase [Chengkuizengella sediminis]NDI36047.1 alpha/beta hydrolase [Chengkuizengella sediminis]
MPIDPQIHQLLQKIGKRMTDLGHPPISQLTPEQSRYFHREARKMFVKQREGEVTVTNKIIHRNIHPDLPVRIYQPIQQESHLPILVYFHGGGWVFGDLESTDDVCSFLAKVAKCIVVSVQYRLAPENKYPLPFIDAVDAVRWTYHNAGVFGGDANRIAVGGESSGANLAAVAAIKIRESDDIKLVAQLLITPVTNYGFNTSSYRAGYTYSLSKETLIWFWNHYLENAEQGKEIYASPLQVQTAEGLPPTLIITAELDPLRDDGFLYAEKLKSSGVDVEYICYEGYVHSFVHMIHIVERTKYVLHEIALRFGKML